MEEQYENEFEEEGNEQVATDTNAVPYGRFEADGTHSDAASSEYHSPDNYLSQVEYDHAAASETLLRLCHDTHTSPLDTLLLRKYLIDPRPDGTTKAIQTGLLLRCIQVMTDHRNKTLDTLRVIVLREKVVQQLAVLAADCQEGLNTLDLQALALKHLYELQTHTLQVVESIVSWRNNLTRPFGFLYNGRNYLLKVICDCARLERSELGKVLPLQLSAHPLLANVPSIGLFRQKHQAVTYPLKRNHKAVEAPINPQLQKRLDAAENVIRGELDLQISLHKELLEMCSQSALMVPALYLPKVIYPSGGRDGIKLVSLEMLDTMQASLLESLRSIVSMPLELLEGTGAAESIFDEKDDVFGVNEADQLKMNEEQQKPSEKVHPTASRESAATSSSYNSFHVDS